MNKSVLAVAAATLLVPAATLHAQTPPPPFQSVNCVKIQPGKGAEYRRFMDDVWAKLNQVRADEGRLTSASLLLGVFPAGEEARCDALTVVNYDGAPPANSNSTLEADLKKAGVHMSLDEFFAKRSSVVRLVASELWRPLLRAGQARKGNYVAINYMTVHNIADYLKFEREVWHPMAEQMVKDGTLTGWVFSRSMLPGGSEVKYPALSADIFPTFEAALKGFNMRDAFAKAHPGKNFEETTAPISKVRTLAKRHLYVVEQRIAKSNR